MPLTIQKVRAAFQDAMPRLRDEFEQRVNDRSRSIAHEHDYRRRFPVEVLRMAETEVRGRSALAAQRVRELLESGWRPETPTGVRSAYGEMYAQFDDWRKDPSSDLYQLVEKAFDLVGVHAPETAIDHARRLGEVQVQAANEALSDLEVYAAKFVDLASLGAPSDSARQSADSAQSLIAPPWQYDVFISHASADKKPFVEDLAGALVSRGLRVWYDKHTIRIGDSIREKIDDGLKSSKHAVIVLSRAFFSRGWPAAEVDALLLRQTSERTNVILPVWHDVTYEEVKHYSNLIGSRFAMRSSDGVDAIADEIVAVVRES